MNIPVIIHYKDNKKDDGLDLRLTLRSFDRFIENLGEVVIVGDTHEWLKDVTHIPYRNPHKRDKDANIIMACLKGAFHLMESGYEGDVIVASDDCVLLQPYFPTLYFEETAYQFLEAFPRRFSESPWWERPYQSIIHCMTMGWNADNCETHVPQFLSVGSILTMMDARIGESILGVKTLMVNAERAMGGRAAECVVPHRVHPSKLTDDLFNSEACPRFCNWCPETETPEFKQLLKEIFTFPGKFENNGL